MERLNSWKLAKETISVTVMIFTICIKILSLESVYNSRSESKNTVSAFFNIKLHWQVWWNNSQDVKTWLDPVRLLETFVRQLLNSEWKHHLIPINLKGFWQLGSNYILTIQYEMHPVFWIKSFKK